MATKWDRCKAFTIHGAGGELIISETIDRLAIEISIRHPGETHTQPVRLNKQQFEALCNFNSAYDGLEVHAVPPKPLPPPAGESSTEIPAYTPPVREASEGEA